jgi:signal transduction histidine kinase
LQKEARQKALDLNISIPEQLPAMIKGDPNHIRQVITYFISNALKQSMSVKVDINLIGTKEDISMIELTFQDAGPGLTEEELDVCRPCFRIERSLFTLPLGYLPKI